MDKKTFLEELRKSLRVLREEELQDIIGEYEQHIDMKVKNGLTVEQAIADFGNVKELAAEILEAYHVRAEYSMTGEPDTDGKNDEIQQKQQIEPVPPGDKWEETVNQPQKDGARDKRLEFADKSFKRFGVWLHTLWSLFLKSCRWCEKQITRPFAWAKAKWRGWNEKRTAKKGEMNTVNCIDAEDTVNVKLNSNINMPMEKGNLVNMKPSNIMTNAKIHTAKWVGRTGRGICGMMKQVWSLLVHVTIWCIRVCWNCCAAGAALLAGGFGLMVLFATGVLVVLWMQGYPLAGLTIGCFGLVLCLFAAAALGWTLMWRRPQPETETVEMEEGQHA